MWLIQGFGLLKVGNNCDDDVVQDDDSVCCRERRRMVDKTTPPTAYLRDSLIYILNRNTTRIAIEAVRYLLCP